MPYKKQATAVLERRIAVDLLIGNTDQKRHVQSLHHSRLTVGHRQLKTQGKSIFPGLAVLHEYFKAGFQFGLALHCLPSQALERAR
jgi:hypothetical protein